MPLYLKIALRYLFGKKSTNAINVITGISMTGIAIGTAALILIMSVFNGFEQMMKKYLDAFNPDVKIEIVEGKFFNPDSLLEILVGVENIGDITQSVEDVAIFDYKENQQVGILKGVDDNYLKVSAFEEAMMRGEYVLEKDDMNYCLVALGISSKLNVNLRDPLSALKIYMPKRKKRGAFDSEFKSRTIMPAGVFSLRNEKDQEYVMSDLKFAQELLELRNQISYLEISLKDPSQSRSTITEIQNLIGSDYHVMDRYEQDESFLKVMNVEKWIAFLILGFTLLLIIFNVIGSLWMIVLEKKRDISVLQAIGLEKSQIKKIFYTEGLLISVFGFIIGLIIAYLLYIAQLKFGFIGVSNGFATVSYPILMEFSDVLAVLLLVIVLGWLASIPATRRASKVSAYIRSE